MTIYGMEGLRFPRKSEVGVCTLQGLRLHQYHIAMIYADLIDRTPLLLNTFAKWTILGQQAHFVCVEQGTYCAYVYTDIVTALSTHCQYSW